MHPTRFSLYALPFNCVSEEIFVHKSDRLHNRRGGSHLSALVGRGGSIDQVRVPIGREVLPLNPGLSRYADILISSQSNE